MRRTRRYVLGRAAVVGVAVAALLTGCSFTNPATIATPYPPSDGTAGEIPDAASGGTLNLRNFLLVATAKGEPGTVAGALANDGTSAVTVTLRVLDDTNPDQPTPIGEAKVEVPGGGLVLIGPGGAALDVAAVPVTPGAKLLLEATTGAGSDVLQLPVLAAENEYATVTPTAAPSPTDG